MGMSTYIVGLKSSDNPMYQKHKRVLLACIDAGVKKLPKETADFFGEEYAERYLLDEILEVEIKSTEKNEDGVQSFYVKVSDLPPEADVIRFTNSW